MECNLLCYTVGLQESERVSVVLLGLEGDFQARRVAAGKVAQGGEPHGIA